MQLNKKHDILLNIFLPVLVGIIIYALIGTESLLQVIKNYLPDWLWAYSYTAAILIVWDRKPKLCWILIVIGSVILFEVSQYFHFIAGTGDFLDIIVYFVAMATSYLTNKFMQEKFNYATNHSKL